MRTTLRCLKRYFWPLSATLLGPWSGSLLLSLSARLTSGNRVGTYILDHYDTLQIVLVSLLSLYFVLAFMMWVVGRRSQVPGGVETSTSAASDLSTGQVLGWGLLGVLLLPMLVALSVLPYKTSVVAALSQAFGVEPAMGAGFLWLVSIAALIMTPIMVVWLVWMWRAWVMHKAVPGPAKDWEYEYE